MKMKGQGALEYLLLIGGAILIAAIVLSIMTGIGGDQQKEIDLAKGLAICAKYGEKQLCEHKDYGKAQHCVWDTTDVNHPTCMFDPNAP